MGFICEVQVLSICQFATGLRDASKNRLSNQLHRLCSVPKGLIPQVLAELRQVELQAPIKAGSVVIDNVAGTGIAVLASRDMPKA